MVTCCYGKNSDQAIIIFDNLVLRIPLLGAVPDILWLIKDMWPKLINEIS